MFNLLMKGGGWEEDGQDLIERNRLFEFTDTSIKDTFVSGDRVDFDSLRHLPSIFVPEIRPDFGDDQLARVGSVVDVRTNGNNLRIEYSYDRSLPPIPNDMLMTRFASEWGIEIKAYEHYRTHWAIKNVDLYRSLLAFFAESHIRPSVFKIPSYFLTAENLVSVMMPMRSDFDEVYATIRQSANDINLRCRRADEIWNSQAIMQDVANLIAESVVVIVDCTGKNPNVFYEMGIAHTLGRSVIPITQSPADVPFDITHLRYIRYLNNNEGRQELRSELIHRLEELTTR